METFAKRILTVIAATLLLVYVGYHIFLAAYSPFTLRTAQDYSEYETIDTEGIVLRDETLIASETEGYVYYVTENGDRVSQNGRIADLYKDRQTALTQQRLTELDEEIEQLKNIQEQGQNNRTNLSIITTQLKKVQAEMVSEMASTNFTRLEELSAQMLSLMNKQQITIGKVEDFETRIAQLQSKRDQLAKTDTMSIGPITSPVAGYFVNTVDGYEANYGTDLISVLTPAKIEEALSFQPIADSSGYIGKVVSGYEWYLACVIPADSMTQLFNNSTIRIRLPFVSNNVIPVTLVAENRDQFGNMAVVFRCDYMSSELSAIRKEQVQILVQEHTGLVVPDDAIRFNENQESGVFVKEGNILYFRRIQVLYHNEKERYSISKPVDDFEYLQKYDDIVVGGRNLYDGKIVH
ncbi:MAG: hypothetical protein IKV35_02300 [Clostridia bacterium]|nr:hypothetical protein [Clostridia bacterium]